MSEEKSKGLGDTIKKVTNAMGIKQCGACKKRQQKLNALFPYKSDEHKKTHEELVAENKKKHDDMLAALRDKGGL
tara:strand:+ start:3381 stop:3605 length:225 start_codon:yes stop_codon:yes gene_type:complete